jgi:hypothetical protein
MKPDAEWLLVEIRKLRAQLGAVASTGGLRTPLHHTTHESGGTDAIKLDDLATPDDNTDLDATVTEHGLLPKLDNIATHFLNGQGDWVDATASGTDYAVIGMCFDGAGLPLTVGMKDYARYLRGAGTIVSVTILSTDGGATSGSVVIDIWKEGTFASYPPTDADSITGGNEPELSGATHSEDTTLTSYSTVAVAAGDVFGFNIDSCSGITKATIEVRILLT